MRPRFTASACVALALLLPACNGDDAGSTTTPTLAPATSTATPTATSTSTSTSTTAPPTATTTTTTTATSTTATTMPSTSIASTSTIDDATAVDWTQIVTDLRRAEFELSQNPSLEAIDQICATVSECRLTTEPTIEYLLENDLHVEGGTPFEIRSIEYQGTVDDVPLNEALGVVLIVRETVTDQSDVALVRGDGSVFSAVEPDPTLESGQQISRTITLGRDTVDDPWRLSVIGGTA